MKKIFLIGSLVIASNLAYSQDLILNRAPLDNRVITNTNSNTLEESQKSLLSQMAQLKQQKLNYEKSQDDFYNALNDRTQSIVQREKDLNVLGAELLAGLDKIENSKKELQDSINQYNAKYKQLATMEATLIKREANLRELENNLANQDLVLITKADQLTALQNNLNSKDSQLKAQALEIAQLKLQLSQVTKTTSVTTFAQSTQSTQVTPHLVRKTRYKRVRKYSSKVTTPVKAKVAVTKTVAPKVAPTKKIDPQSPSNPTDFFNQSNVTDRKFNTFAITTLVANK